MHLASLPDRRKDQDAAAPCLADEHGSLDNAQFHARVVRAAAALARHGVGPGAVVALVLPNSADFVVALFAAWRLDATVTPVNPALTDAEVAYQVTDSAAMLLVGDRTVPGVATVPAAALDEPGDDPRQGRPPSHEDQLALLIYTSGTTGRPKGVMLDHANLSAMCQMCVAAVQLTSEDHCLLVLPLFHVNGIVVSVLSPLLAGGRTTVAGRFSPSTFFRAVEATRPTYFSAVPAIYAMLSALPQDEQPDLSSVRVAVCGAAPMPAELIERFEARYGVAVVEGYGLSEGTCASTINPVDGRRKPGTVGLPLPGQEVAVMAPDGSLVQDGSTGEVVVRGPNVMRGYLNRPEETATTVVDGWLHTGDVGRFDEDGYLVLVDRIKDLIIRGGENIYPKEIESVLYTHPAVLEAAVVGQPDPVLGEVPVAHVSLRPGAEPDVGELERLCGEQLSAYKRPVAIHVVPELPKNSVGKIDKLALRDPARATAV
jgi:acyl-CoA synthetase (AMP-forming)/AMP-acid ligase II